MMHFNTFNFKERIMIPLPCPASSNLTKKSNVKAISVVVVLGNRSRAELLAGIEDQGESSPVTSPNPAPSENT